jgi:opacity protein-like surface antigen
LALLFLLGASLVVAADKAAVPTDVILKYTAQWLQSYHSHNATANRTNNDALGKPDDAGCLICHDAAGAVEWAATGYSTEFGTPKVHPAGGAAGPNCISCHTMEGDPSGPMLRLEGDTPMTFGGFAVENAGTGALCIVCHNGRRGLYNDKDKPVMNQRAPHEASSADMLMGVNYFFVEVGVTSPHMDVENTCAGCHMDPEMGGGEHTFKASWDGCKTCHADYNGEDFKKAAVEARNKLDVAVADAVKTLIQAGIDAGKFEMKATYEDESEDENFVKITKGKVESVKNQYFHGSQTYTVKIDGKEYLITIKNIKLDGHAFLDTVQGQTVAKAGWNLYSFDHDRSDGAHNPPFHAEVVEATSKALAGIDLAKITPITK